ncbi:hypothetical protein HanHA300_Chr17g0655331 [Helianthus annuus]|nr:hypothetical protein HanHA300_Chr17g0655331 [Helianthus annuus]KAJ0636397.1 hypothetical protein HanOQP8_Chr17g0661441 [Helianthus annuus]KAJ0804078.1 hypothetical protein HanLR1_Chr00c1485g0807801 [Helianthus annuus]
MVCSDGGVALAMIQTMTTDLKIKPRRIQRNIQMSLNVVRFHRRHWWQSCYLWAGKILSIICSALQWLVDRKQRQNNDSLVDMHPNGKDGDCVGSDEESDWLRNSFGSKEVESPKKKVKVKKRLGFSSKQRDEIEIEESFRDLYSQLRDIEVDLEQNVIVRGDGERLDDKELLVDEYESGDEKNGLCKRKGGGVCCGWSSSDDEDEDKRV